LSALRGAPSFDDGQAGVDRDAVRRFFQSPVSDVTRVSRPWEHHGRKFVQVRVDTADIRALSKSVPFAWSAYGFTPRGEIVTFVQAMGPSALPNAKGPRQGDELV